MKPRLRAHFEGEPNFADLLSALKEFGEPFFTIRGQESFCEVNIPTPDGEESVCGRTEAAANPSGAGLACLLALLERFDRECEHGLADLEAHLRTQP
jgi:hypothetical protein